MEDDIEKIRELIHPKAQIGYELDKLGQSCYDLKEPKEAGSVIRIKGVPENSIVFNLDDFFPAPERIFAGTKGECCRSDYVIVSQDSEKRYIVLIELKKDADDDFAHIRKQLKGAWAFMFYCQSILQIFWNYDFPLHLYSFHFVICTRTSRKWSNKYDNNMPSNTDIMRPLHLEGSNAYQFNRLIGRKPR